MVFSELNRLAEKARGWMERNGCRYDQTVVFNAITALDSMGFFVPAGALARLKALLAAGPVARAEGDREYCYYCGAWLPAAGGVDLEHLADCPFVAAVAFVEGLSTSTADGPPR